MQRRCIENRCLVDRPSVLIGDADPFDVAVELAVVRLCVTPAVRSRMCRLARTIDKRHAFKPFGERRGSSKDNPGTRKSPLLAVICKHPSSVAKRCCRFWLPHAAKANNPSAFACNRVGEIAALGGEHAARRHDKKKRHRFRWRCSRVMTVVLRYCRCVYCCMKPIFFICEFFAAASTFAITSYSAS